MLSLIGFQPNRKQILAVYEAAVPTNTNTRLGSKLIYKYGL